MLDLRELLLLCAPSPLLMEAEDEKVIAAPLGATWGARPRNVILCKCTCMLAPETETETLCPCLTDRSHADNVRPKSIHQLSASLTLSRHDTRRDVVCRAQTVVRMRHPARALFQPPLTLSRLIFSAKDNAEVKFEGHLRDAVEENEGVLIFDRQRGVFQCMCVCVCVRVSCVFRC